MSPTRYDRPANLIVCTGVPAEVETLGTDVEFYTRIETDSSNTTMSDATTTTMWVSGEVLGSLANRICGKSTRNLGGSCILSISSGTPDERIVSCSPEKEASKSCTWYRGSLRLLHMDECSSNDISSQVLGVLRNITTTDFSGSTDLGSVKITDVEFTDAPSLNKKITGKSVESSRSRLTPGGASLTAMLALALVGLVVLLLGIRRVRKYRLDKIAYDDSVIGIKKRKSRSNIEPNWRDLGARHSGMDCRHCNSLMCSECGNEQNQVRMLKFDRNTLTNMSNVNEIVKGEKSGAFKTRQQQQQKQTSSQDVESDGIRINGSKDFCPSDDVGDDVVQPKNGYKSILL